MSRETKISIIIPVYNAEKYIEECMESLTGQSLKEIEIICVNDGSTDDSLEILRGFARGDGRVKIIDQKNAGIAAARNSGIARASGEYILFVDSDDFIDELYCEVLYSAAENRGADLVCGGVADYYSRKKIKKKKVLGEFGEEEKKCIKIDDSNRAFFFLKGYQGIVTAWGRLIKRKMMEDNGLLFYGGRICEDIPFTSLNFLYADTVAVEESVCYYYRKNVEGALSKKTDDMVSDVLKNFKTLKEELVRKGKAGPEIIKVIDLNVCDVLFGYYNKWNAGNFSRCSVPVIKELYAEIKNTYFDFFNIEDSVLASDNKIFRIKYRFFAFGFRHNIYIMPKIVRFLRNLARIFCFQ